MNIVLPWIHSGRKSRSRALPKSYDCPSSNHENLPVLSKGNCLKYHLHFFNKPLKISPLISLCLFTFPIRRDWNLQTNKGPFNYLLLPVNDIIIKIGVYAEVLQYLFCCFFNYINIVSNVFLFHQACQTFQQCEVQEHFRLCQNLWHLAWCQAM